MVRQCIEDRGQLVKKPIESLLLVQTTNKDNPMTIRCQAQRISIGGVGIIKPREINTIGNYNELLRRKATVATKLSDALTDADESLSLGRRPSLYNNSPRPWVGHTNPGQEMRRPRQPTRAGSHDIGMKKKSLNNLNTLGA